MKKLLFPLALLSACSMNSLETNMCTWADTGIRYTAQPGECVEVCSVEPSRYAVIRQEEDACETHPWECVLITNEMSAMVIEDWTDRLGDSELKYTVEIFPCEEWNDRWQA